MVDANRSGLEEYVKDLVTAAQEDSATGSWNRIRSITTAERVVTLFDPEGRKHTTSKAATNALKAAGARRVKRVRGSGDSTPYFRGWSLADHDRWESAEPDEIRDVLLKLHNLMS
jgi:hypothetical protein